MIEPIAIPTEEDLQDIKVKVFRDGKFIELSLHELPLSVQQTAYAILSSSCEF
jgi:hypothetical protein